MKTAIVIQGGGSYGALTAGRICRRKKKYDIAVGSSTGALIAPFALCQKYDELETAYTSVNNNDIYSSYPFTNDGRVKLGMFIWAWLRHKKGITDSEPLRKLIKTYYTQFMHNQVQSKDKDLYIVVCQLNSKRSSAQYCNAKDYNYRDFCDIIWASTLVPFLFPPMIINRYQGTYGNVSIEYCDGGVVENVGLKKAVEIGAKNIDVFLHDLNTGGYKQISENLVHVGIRALEIQRQEVTDSDLYDVQLSADVNLEINYLPEKLEGNGKMDFNQELMIDWFNRGWNIEENLKHEKP